MDRWYLISPALRLPFAIRLHHIKLADGPRLPHNHPYTFYSFVLFGWYMEEKQHLNSGQATTNALLKSLNDDVMPDSILERRPPRYVRHKPFEVHEIRREEYHRITEVSADGVWTLIVHPRKPKDYQWGFLDTDGAHVDRHDYKRPEGF